MGRGRVRPGAELVEVATGAERVAGPTRWTDVTDGSRAAMVSAATSSSRMAEFEGVADRRADRG